MFDIEHDVNINLLDLNVHNCNMILFLTNIILIYSIYKIIIIIIIKTL